MDLSMYMAVVKSGWKKHIQEKFPHLLFFLVKVINASLAFVSLIISLMVIAEYYFYEDGCSMFSGISQIFMKLFILFFFFLAIYHLKLIYNLS